MTDSSESLTCSIFLLFPGLLVVFLTFFLVDGAGSFLTFTNLTDFLYAIGISTSVYLIGYSLLVFIGCTFPTATYGAIWIYVHGCAIVTPSEGHAIKIWVSSITLDYLLDFIS